MTLDKKEVEHVARLARLGLTTKEIEKFTHELSTILDFIAQLKEVDVKNVPETAHVIGLTNITRPDKSESSLTRDTFLEEAPATTKDQLKVKGIFN